MARVQNSSAHSTVHPWPCVDNKTCSPISFLSGEWSKTCWKGSMKHLYDKMCSPFCEQTAITQVSGFPVSRMMNWAILCHSGTLLAGEVERALEHEAWADFWKICQYGQWVGAEWAWATSAANKGSSMLVRCLSLAFSMPSCCCCSPTKRPWATFVYCQPYTSAAFMLQVK